MLEPSVPRLSGIVFGTLVVAVVLLPLTIVPSAWDSFRYPKVLVLRSVAVIIVAASLLEWIWGGSTDGKWRHDPLVWIVVAAIGWLCFTVAVSPQPMASAWASTNVVAALILFFAARRVGRSSRGRWPTVILWLLLVPGVVNSLVLILQQLDIWHPLIQKGEMSRLYWEDQILLRKAALMGNRDDVGMYLLIPLIVALERARSSRESARLIAAAALLTIVAGILISTTLTAVLLAATAIVAFAALNNTNRIRTVLILIIVMVAAVSLLEVPLRERLSASLSSLRSGAYETATGNRFGAWASAVAMFVDHPVAGVGPGRYPVEYLAVMSCLRQRHETLFPSESTVHFDMVHNDYLEIAAETGLPGLVLFLGGALALLRFLFRASGTATGLAASILLSSMLVGALIQFPFQLAGVYGSFAVAIGVMTGRAEVTS